MLTTSAHAGQTPRGEQVGGNKSFPPLSRSDAPLTPLITLVIRRIRPLLITVLPSPSGSKTSVPKTAHGNQGNFWRKYSAIKLGRNQISAHPRFRNQVQKTVNRGYLISYSLYFISSTQRKELFSLRQKLHNIDTPFA